MHRRIDSQEVEVAIDDTALVQQAQQHDQNAFEELVRRYQDVAFRVACVITGDVDEAQDAAQTGFIKAIQALDTFRSDAPFRPWLLRIVANEAKNRVRSSVRRATEPLDEQFVSLEPSPHDQAERNERQRALIEAVRTLDADDQRIIAYRYFFDLTEREMADLLECPRGTVKSRLSRATARLRETMLAQEGASNERA